MSEHYLTALHEAGHAIVGKAVGHDVYQIYVQPEAPFQGFCEGGHFEYPGAEQNRALIALGGYFAAAIYGQGLGFDVNDWDTAQQDWEEFQAGRGGMTYRHARRKVIAILTERREELLALAKRVESEVDVRLDPHPSEYAEEVVAL